jgi:mono/diheme cytochrome c family protein
MKLNLFLAIALASSVAAGFLFRLKPSQPNVEFMPEMVRPASYGAYSANPDFPDGKTLQEPPVNTIARGFRSVSYQPSEADAIRAGEELTNPYKLEDPAAQIRGAFVFRNWCLPCHGASGRGDGQVALRGFPAPPPLNSARTLAMKDGQIFHIVTYGQKNMPPYASQVSEDDRWKVILHVRSLQGSATAAQPATGPASAPVAEKGKEKQR